MPIPFGASGQDFAVAEGSVDGCNDSVYSCAQCEQPFLTQSAYQDHVILEQTDKRCACAQCSEIFRWSGNMGDNASYHDHERRHGSLDHRCPHCKVCFASSEILLDHLDGNRGDVPIGVLDMGCRFACSQCAHTFISCEARCNHSHSENQLFHQALNVVPDRCVVPRQGNNTGVVRSPHPTPLSPNNADNQLQRRKPVSSLFMFDQMIRDRETAVDRTNNSSVTPTANGSETKSHKMLSGVLSPCSIEKNATSFSNLAFCSEKRPVTAQEASDSSEANSPVPPATPTLGACAGAERRAAVKPSPSVANEMSTYSLERLRDLTEAHLKNAKLSVLRSKLSIADNLLTNPRSKLTVADLKSWITDLEERLKAADDRFREGDAFLLPSETCRDGRVIQADPLLVECEMDPADFTDSTTCAERWLFNAEKMLAFFERSMPLGSRK